MEATFTYTFWALWKSFKDPGVSHLCLWDRHTLGYIGLCTHSCLKEGIRGKFNLSAQELEELDAKRLMGLANMQAVRNRKYHLKEMATNRVEYLAKSKEWNRITRERHRDRYNANLKVTRAEDKLNEVYYCALCKTSCQQQSDLDEHFATAKHKRKMDELALQETYRYECKPCAYRTNKSSSWSDHLKSARHKKKVPSDDVQLKSEMRYYCEACDYGTDVQNTWKVHCKSDRHRRNVPEPDAVQPSNASLDAAPLAAPKTKAKKRFNCDLCGFSTDKPSDWEDHCLTLRHKQKVAAIAKVESGPKGAVSRKHVTVAAPRVVIPEKEEEGMKRKDHGATSPRQAKKPKVDVPVGEQKDTKTGTLHGFFKPKAQSEGVVAVDSVQAKKTKHVGGIMAGTLHAYFKPKR